MEVIETVRGEVKRLEDTLNQVSTFWNQSVQARISEAAESMVCHRNTVMKLTKAVVEELLSLKDSSAGSTRAATTG